jgi:hypothetical protein
MTRVSWSFSSCGLMDSPIPTKALFLPLFVSCSATRTVVPLGLFKSWSPSAVVPRILYSSIPSVWSIDRSKYFPADWIWVGSLLCWEIYAKNVIDGSRVSKYSINDKAGGDWGFANGNFTVQLDLCEGFLHLWLHWMSQWKRVVSSKKRNSEHWGVIFNLDRISYSKFTLGYFTPQYCAVLMSIPEFCWPLSSSSSAFVNLALDPSSAAAHSLHSHDSLLPKWNVLTRGCSTRMSMCLWSPRPPGLFEKRRSITIGTMFQVVIAEDLHLQS